MSKSEEEILETVEELTAILNREKLTQRDLVSVIATFLFSIGSSLEDCGDVSAENVLTMYASRPTLGSALMAQAMHMNETWSHTERKETDERTEVIQRETERE